MTRSTGTLYAHAAVLYVDQNCAVSARLRQPVALRVDPQVERLAQLCCHGERSPTHGTHVSLGILIGTVCFRIHVLCLIQQWASTIESIRLYSSQWSLYTTWFSFTAEWIYSCQEWWMRVRNRIWLWFWCTLWLCSASACCHSLAIKPSPRCSDWYSARVRVSVISILDAISHSLPLGSTYVRTLVCTYLFLSFCKRGV